MFELSDLDGDGNISRREFGKVAAMLSPAFGAAIQLANIGSTSDADSPKTARLRQLYDLYASDQHGLLGMDKLVVLIETILSAERALGTDSVDEIHGGESIDAGNSGDRNRATAEREASWIEQFISNHRKHEQAIEGVSQPTCVDAQRTGLPTSSTNLNALVL